MKPAPFEYKAPDSLDESLSIIQEHGYDAKILAGGQSLVPMMNFRLVQPAIIVDINSIPNLDTIQQDRSGSLRLGALVRQNRIEKDPVVAEIAPLLTETMPFIAHPQIRNRGTLGGSLVHADPAAELPVVTVALNARFRLQHVESDRWVNAEDFFLGLFTTGCTPVDMLVEVTVPPMTPRTGWAFDEVARRHGDYGLAGVAVVVSVDENGVCDSARLVYMSAGETPMIATQSAGMLVGERPSETLFGEVAEFASREEIAPVSDIHATVDFKRHLARVLTVRVLKRAFEKAEGRK